MPSTVQPPRTVEQIDKELADAVDTRVKARTALQRGNHVDGGASLLVTTIDTMNDRIETLLDERSQTVLLEQFSALPTL
jgi:hypothetical protein